MDQNEVGNRKRGRIRPDPQGHHDDSRQRETRTSRQRAGCIPNVLAQNVEMDSQGVQHDFEECRYPQSSDRERSCGVESAPGEDLVHLVAVFGSKRGGIEVQEGPVNAHHSRSGAKPRPRAIRTNSVSRPASALATAVPKEVMR